MKRSLFIAPSAAIMASCVLSAASGQESILSSIAKFEKENRLPEGSLQIKRYARFYKVESIELPNKPNSFISVMHFRYIQRNMKPGLYVMSGDEGLPNDPSTDGGCLLIEGFFRRDDGKLLAMECAAPR